MGERLVAAPPQILGDRPGVERFGDMAAARVADAEAAGWLAAGAPFDVLYWGPAGPERLARLAPENARAALGERLERVRERGFDNGLNHVAEALAVALAAAPSAASARGAAAALAETLLDGDGESAAAAIDNALVEDGGALNILATARGAPELAGVFADIDAARVETAVAQAQAALSTAAGRPMAPATGLGPSPLAMGWTTPAGEAVTEMLFALDLPADPWRGGLILTVDRATVADLRDLGETVTPLHRLPAAYAIDRERLTPTEMELVLAALASGEASAQVEGTRIAAAEAMVMAVAWRAAAATAAPTARPEPRATLEVQIAALAAAARGPFGLAYAPLAAALQLRGAASLAAAALAEAGDALDLIAAAASAGRAVGPSNPVALRARIAGLARDAADGK